MEQTQKAGHTPGPWSYSVFAEHTATPGFPAAVYALDRENGETEDGGDDPSFVICDFDETEYENLPEANANARLIAAAPDLLATLKAASDFVAVNNIEGAINIIVESRAIIDKAEGGAA